MKKNVTLIILACCILLSCSKEVIISFEKDNKNTNTATFSRISPDNNILTSEEAASVASMMNRYNKNFTKGERIREIDNVISLYDSTNNPVIYVVNYTSNEGYSLISATKDYFPILANVYGGSYNNLNLPESILINEYKLAIANSKQMPADSITKIRKLWNIYENNSHQIPPKTKSTEFDAFVTDQLQEWNNNIDIHAFYNLNDAYGMLPTNVYSHFCSVAQGLAHPEYDYMTYSYVIETTDRQTVNPNNYLLGTTWLQTIPYNLSAEPDIDGNYPLLGCTAVALGQIMNYHKWPTSFSWENMPNSLTPYNTTPTTLSDFLYEVADEIKLSNAPLNYSDIDNCYDALVNKYGYSGSKSSHNMLNVINSILNNRPVFMSGVSNTDNDGDGVTDGHAWVCDGYEVSRVQIVYTLYVIETSHTLNYIQAQDPVPGEILTEGYYFHMNWAQTSLSNGWYLEGPNATTNINYTNNREDITNIKPNK